MSKICEVCGSELLCRWTDTHGVGVCVRCGTPYRLYHYDENGQPVNKPPECQLTPEWIKVARIYFASMGRMVDPGGFDMGLCGGRTATYSGATQDDSAAWNDWLTKHAAELLAASGAVK